MTEVQLLWLNEYIHQLHIVANKKKITSGRTSSKYKKGYAKYIFISIMVVGSIKMAQLDMNKIHEGIWLLSPIWRAPLIQQKIGTSREKELSRALDHMDDPWTGSPV
jgi:hypothetical protein